MSAAQSEAVDLPVVRQSFRCFWFGVIGLIPGIGVMLAWQALSTFKRICEASGETPRVSFPIALFLIAVAINPLLHVGLPAFGDAVGTIFLVSIFAAWSCVRYFQSSGARWNPARNWAWAGGTLGAIGLAISLLALEAVYVAAFGRILRGAP